MMNRIRPVFALLGILCGLATSGCQVHRYGALPLRAFSDCPDHFVSRDAPASPPSDSSRSPMVDPRDGTQIELVRSDRGWGDYQVPAGRYGVQKGELLRLE